MLWCEQFKLLAFSYKIVAITTLAGPGGEVLIMGQCNTIVMLLLETHPFTSSR